MRMEIGSIEHINDCEDALNSSELGKQYFAGNDSARNAVLEGINSGSLYVALVKGKCVGFVYYIPNGAFHSFPYLHLIAVKEEHRCKGYGKLMIEYIEDMIFKTKEKIFLVVADFNPRGRAFYEKLGYKQAGTIPSLYREGINEHLMMKEYKHKA